MSLRSDSAPIPLLSALPPRGSETELRSAASADRVTGANDVHGIDLSGFDSDLGPSLAVLPVIIPPPAASVSPPVSPPASPRFDRDPSRNFLSSLRNRMSPEQEKRSARSPSRRVKEEESIDRYRATNGSMSKVYHLKKNPGSTPDLELVGSSETASKQGSEGSTDRSESQRHQPTSQQSDENANLQKRKENKGFRMPLTRTKSTRQDSGSKPRSEVPPLAQPPKTAPLSQDWSDSSFLRNTSKERRGKSADRAGPSESQERNAKASSTFMLGGKQVMSKAKSGGGSILNRLGKMAKTAGGSHDKEVPIADYVLKVINLPLVEQTRITRISSTLDSCRDKTEFWMPSLPWRCIDYLNLNCEHEGLYRIPGSAPEVKRWQVRFDTQLDVDLLDETELYDPNTIASMMKSWLRDLPTEIMPKTMQHALGDELGRDNPNFQRIGEPVPQKLRNALSQLPPFNYYLLFAITCHLSLLLSHREKNKMDLNNLSICIGPPLDLERWLFNYLVGDWRNCWQGCYTEKRYHAFEEEVARGRAKDSIPFPDTAFDFSYAPADYVRDNSGGTSTASSDAVPTQSTEAGVTENADTSPGDGTTHVPEVAIDDDESDDVLSPPVPPKTVEPEIALPLR